MSVYNANMIARSLQAECGPELVRQEGERIGMQFNANALCGTVEQWIKLDYELHRKPSDPTYEEAGLDLI